MPPPSGRRPKGTLGSITTACLPMDPRQSPRDRSRHGFHPATSPAQDTERDATRETPMKFGIVYALNCRTHEAWTKNHNSIGTL